jgi:hypothetical protein
MEVEGCSAFLDDLLVCDDADKRICSGFFRLVHSTPLE